MSRVTITIIEPGDEISPTALNASLSSWNSASVAVNAANVRDEGIDDINIVDNTITPLGSGGLRTCDPFAFDVDIQPGAGTPPTSPTAVTFTSGVLRAVAIGPIDYDGTDGEMLRVRCNTEVRLERSAVQWTVHLQLKYSTDWDGDPATIGAATWNALTSTLRKKRMSATYTNVIRIHGFYGVCHRFDPTGVVNSSTLYFALFAHVTESGGPTVPPTLTLSDPNMHAELRRR